MTIVETSLEYYLGPTQQTFNHRFCSYIIVTMVTMGVIITIWLYQAWIYASHEGGEDTYILSGVAKGGARGGTCPPWKMLCPPCAPPSEICDAKFCICHYLVVPPHQTAVPPLCPPRIKSLVTPLYILK